MNQSWQRQKEAARNNPVMQINATDRALERLEQLVKRLEVKHETNATVES